MSEPFEKQNTSTNDVDKVNNESQLDLEMTSENVDNEEESLVTIEEFKQMLDDDFADLEDAVALFGDSDADQCTYPKGYVDRQAIFACATCEMNKDENGQKYMAGFCYACSENCHKDHVTYELYLKRNFCCDCGNDKFANECKLFEKSGINVDNKYNHNFVGLYCFCNRPYPDPASEGQQEVMLQCGICEDWFHPMHLEIDEDHEDFVEIICKACVKKNSFLVYYQEFGYVGDSTSIIQQNHEEKYKEKKADINKKVEMDPSAKCQLKELKKKYREKYGTEEIDQSKFKTIKCCLEYRFQFCKCPECWKMYDELEIPFICVAADMTSIHQLKNLEKDQDKIMKKITPTRQNVIAAGLQTWKKMMQDFFDSKKGQTTVVTLKECESVLEQLRNAKENADATGGIQHLCRIVSEMPKITKKKS